MKLSKVRARVELLRKKHKLATKPKDYQLRGVKRMIELDGRALLADEMGLGKTLQALLWARLMDVSPIIVVCPASLKYNWERECSKHFNMRAEVIEGKRVPSAGTGLFKRHIIIINYDILGAWLKYLRRLRPELIIVDECHYIKSQEALRTKNVRKLCKGVAHVIAMSGTPLTNRPAELWPTLNLVRPDKFKAFKPFAWKYCKPTRTRWGWQYRGAVNLAHLNRRLRKNLMVRRLKADVLKELPNKTRAVVPIEIEHRKEYAHAVSDFLGWMRKHAPKRVRKAKRAEALVKVGELKRLIGRLKLKAVMNWIDSFLMESDGKLVVFGVHRPIVQALHERYKKISVIVHGGIKGRQRQYAVDQFQKDKKTRIFIGNQAAAAGLNLTAANTVAFAELFWTPGEHDQAVDRTHRIGQKRAVIAYFLIAFNTLEEKLCKLIQEKKSTLNSVMDGDEEVDALDIFDQLLQEIGRD